MCFSVIDYTPTAAVLFESCSLKACSIQPPGPQSAALFGNRVLADVISVVTMRSYWVRVAPDAVTGVPETDTRGDSHVATEAAALCVYKPRDTSVRLNTVGFPPPGRVLLHGEERSLSQRQPAGGEVHPSIPRPGIGVTKGRARQPSCRDTPYSGKQTESAWAAVGSVPTPRGPSPPLTLPVEGPPSLQESEALKTGGGGKGSSFH